MDISFGEARLITGIQECIVELYCCAVSSLRHVAEEAGEGPLALKFAGGL
jgi:hypothetical protein